MENKNETKTEGANQKIAPHGIKQVIKTFMELLHAVLCF
jgi:hypothetical protein